jgi:uncharacterized membrane protein
MLLYLLKVLDNTWVFAVMAALILYLVKLDRGKRFFKRTLLAAIILGAISSLIYAILKRNTGWVVREFYDLGVLWPLLLSLLTFLIFVIPTLVSKKGSGWIIKISSFFVLFLTAARTLPDLFIHPLDFDVGMDSIFNMEYLANLTGYLLGLFIIVLLFGAIRFLLSQTPKKLLPFVVFLAVLGIFLYLLMDATRIMYVRSLLPNIKWIPKLIIFFMGHVNFFLFFQVLVWLIASIAAMLESFTTHPMGVNPAIIRKNRYSLRLKLRAALFLIIIMGFVVFSVTYLRAYQARGPYISEPDPVTSVDDRIFLPLEEVSDGNLHRYSYETQSGTIVRFIVVKKTATAYGVGLDACDICGATGYYQRGDQIICKLCDVVMNKSTIGFPGGCNPVPLKFTIEAGGLVINPKDLENEKRRFQ